MIFNLFQGEILNRQLLFFTQSGMLLSFFDQSEDFLIFFDQSEDFLTFFDQLDPLLGFFCGKSGEMLNFLFQVFREFFVHLLAAGSPNFSFFPMSTAGRKFLSKLELLVLLKFPGTISPYKLNPLSDWLPF